LTEAGGPLGASLDGRPTPAGSCGVPIPDVTVRLVDDGGADAAEIGELWVRSPSVLLSYQNLPELTRERLIDGFFRTGDLFRKDAAGFYYFMGRTDDLFNCGGENIYPREVEEVLLKHQAVLDVAVAPIPHDIKGQAPAALVVLRPGIPATEEELKLHCLANGPAYAHPRRIFIVDALPLAGPGKIDKRAIRRLIDERLSQAASH
jgi:acyl-CoA synthetase (AMP-forming)/AMP-acid ligase II